MAIICVSNLFFLLLLLLFTYSNYFQPQTSFQKGELFLMNWSATKYDFLQGGKGWRLAVFRFFLTREGEVIGQYQTPADKGGGGVSKPPFLDDIICKQAIMQ